MHLRQHYVRSDERTEVGDRELSTDDVTWERCQGALYESTALSSRDHYEAL